MLRSRKTPVLSLEEIEDGLEVTQAINDLEETVTPSPDQVSIDAEKLKDQEQVLDDAKQEELETNSDQSDVLDPGEQVENTEGGDTESNNTEDTQTVSNEPQPKEIKSEIPDDEPHKDDELDGVVDEVQSLETIAELLEACDRLSQEDFNVISTLWTKYRNGSNASLEAYTYVSESVKDILETLYDAVIKVIKGIIKAISDGIEIYKSRLHVAQEDLKTIKSNIRMIGNKTAKNTHITNGYHVIIMNHDTETVKQLKAVIDKYNVFFKSYFDHLKLNFKPFIKSIQDLYNQDLRKVNNITEDEEGNKVINNTGSVTLTKSTLPGVLNLVTEIKGYKKPFENALGFKSETMPGGVMLVAWLAKSPEVDTGNETEILKSKMFMSQDLEYQQPEPELPVMTPNDLNAYVEKLTGVLRTLEYGAIEVSNYSNAMKDLEKYVEKLQKENEVLTAVPHMRAIVAYKRRSASLFTKLVSLTDNFYGHPSKQIIFYGNRFLVASIKYANAVTAEYLTVPKNRKDNS